jgi:hypothetical protein
MSDNHFTQRSISNAVFDDVSLEGAAFNDVNLANEIEDANVEGLMILGIDIHALIQAELTRRDTE